MAVHACMMGAIKLKIRLDKGRCHILKNPLLKGKHDPQHFDHWREPRWEVILAAATKCV